ncbi:acyltransferase [Sphingomonas sp. 28-63-12]|uniref:acyltransferase family protein n=1 Tax=Sphingomonas sp. 28-63-12 TaxID=1970434 RepID=UPI000BC50F3F|nr:MAG: hypothetical protein B7Y47_12030 [Sphingomonas sp. 28-63-12]
MPNRGEKHYVELDGLRGIAAISVMLFHAHIPIFGHAYLAVDFFFMLSGFVIAHAYGYYLTLPGYFKLFARDRIIRLHPLLILFSIVGGAELALNSFALSRTGANWLILDIVAGIFPAPSLWDLDIPNSNIFIVNPPSWSLFWEILVNLIFAFISPYLSNKRLIFILILSVCGIIIATINYDGLNVGWSPDNFLWGIARVMFGFFAGVLIYRIHSAGFLADGGRRYLVAPILIATFVALPYGSAWSIAYDPIIIIVLFPLLLLFAAGSKPLVPSIATLSGTISYPLYLAHTSIIMGLNGAAHRFLKISGNPLALSIIVIITIILSYLIVIYYDKPVRKFLRTHYGSGNH